MGGTGALFSIWGTELEKYDVCKLLRSFDANNKQLRPQIQPLFVLAYEAALLAGHSMEDDDTALAKNALVPLPRCPCTATKNGEDKCRCDTCVAKKLECDDDNRTAPCWKEGAVLERLEMAFCPYEFSSNTNYCKLQAALLREVLGKELAISAPLLVGSCQGHEGPPGNQVAVFLFLMNKVLRWGPTQQHHPGAIKVFDVEELAKKETVATQLESWAFYKAVILLGLNKGSRPCSNVPKRLLVFSAYMEESYGFGLW